MPPKSKRKLSDFQVWAVDAEQYRCYGARMMDKLKLG